MKLHETFTSSLVVVRTQQYFVFLSVAVCNFSLDTLFVPTGVDLPAHLTQVWPNSSGKILRCSSQFHKTLKADHGNTRSRISLISKRDIRYGIPSLTWAPLTRY